MVTDRIRVEWDGDDLLAFDPSYGRVHRIAGGDARMLRDGHAALYEPHLPADVLDAVVRALDARDWDRRRILATSGALAAAGITTALLPSAALATSVGLPFNSYSSSVVITPTSLPGLFGTRVGNNALDRAFGIWEVPDGVTRVEVVAIGTSGGPAGIAWDGKEAPSPYTGVEGRGARVVASLTVIPGHRLVVAFSGASQGLANGGGYGGSAAAVGDIGTGTSGDWLLVAGGGGGAGQAGIVSFPERSYATSGDFLGGDGGDAGTGAAAETGGAGSGASPEDNIGQGGVGATTSAIGTGGAGSGTTGNSGAASIGPTNSGSTTIVGLGGTPNNNESSGGGGGAGLFGGGAGGATLFNGAGGGGGGGASYLRSSRLVDGTQSAIELANRSVLDGPGINLFY